MVGPSIGRHRPLTHDGNGEKKTHARVPRAFLPFPSVHRPLPMRRPADGLPMAKKRPATGHCTPKNALQCITLFALHCITDFRQNALHRITHFALHCITDFRKNALQCITLFALHCITDSGQNALQFYTLFTLQKPHPPHAPHNRFPPIKRICT